MTGEGAGKPGGLRPWGCGIAAGLVTLAFLAGVAAFVGLSVSGLLPGKGETAPQGTGGAGTGSTSRPGTGEGRSSEATKAEEPEVDPLSGTWTFYGMSVTWSDPVEWTRYEKPVIMKISKSGDGWIWTTQEPTGTSSVEFDGRKVVVVREIPESKVYYRCEGVLAGDKISGNIHSVFSGYEHDDPWEATRTE